MPFYWLTRRGCLNKINRPRAVRRRIRPGRLPPSAEHAPTLAHPRTCTLHTAYINSPRLSSFGKKESKHKKTSKHNRRRNSTEEPYVSIVYLPRPAWVSRAPVSPAEVPAAPASAPLLSELRTPLFPSFPVFFRLDFLRGAPPLLSSDARRNGRPAGNFLSMVFA